MRKTSKRYLKHCPMCGSKRIQVQRVSVRLRTGRIVEGIEAEVCLACGERFYDLAAMKSIDDARKKS